MKLSTPVLLSLSALVIFTPGLVLAEDATPTPTPKVGLFRQFREERRELKEDLRDNRQETREDRRTTRAEAKETGTIDRVALRRKTMSVNQNGLYRSFVARATSLEKYQQLISDRITAKLVNLPQNQDLLSAQSKINSSDLKALWTTYQSDLANYSATIKTIDTATDPKSLLPTLKSQAKKVHDDLKAIRQFLVTTLRLMVKAHK